MKWGRRDAITCHPLKREKLRHKEGLDLISHDYSVLGQSENPGPILASLQNYGAKKLMFHFNLNRRNIQTPRGYDLTTIFFFF